MNTLGWVPSRALGLFMNVTLTTAGRCLRDEPEYQRGRVLRAELPLSKPPWPQTRDERVRVQGWYDRDRELKGKR